MRNTNTSFVRNAICRFDNEADQVLRAIADPAVSPMRLVSTAVRTLLGNLVSSYRLRQHTPSETSVIASKLTGKKPGQVFGIFGQRGFDRWSGLTGKAVS